MITLNDTDFKRLTLYIKKNYGIDLSQKKQLIVSRLSNMLEKEGYTDFGPYVNKITSSLRPDLVTDMLNRLTTNYTYFLREEDHFNYLYETVLPELAKVHARDKALYIWSAGCSSGEEPYTISMYLKEFFGANANLWDTRVLATDLSQKILDQAKNPSYREESLSHVPVSWRKKYFVKRSDGSYTVSPSIRDNVVFRPFNLMEPIRFRHSFDVIFCRNVMIYFDTSTRKALVQRLYQATSPGGYLFIGHSEGLDRESCPYDSVAPTVYRRTFKERGMAHAK